MNKLESKFFHSEDKGCELIPKKYFLRKDNKEQELHLNAYFCLTHQVEKICHCGYRFGYHFGTNSKGRL